MEYENDSRWVRTLLRPGENILWSGKPTKRWPFDSGDIPAFLFSLLWCGGVSYGAYTIWTAENSSIVSKLFIIPFLLFGVYTLLGRFVRRIWEQHRLQYALTSQRLIQKNGESITAAELDSLPSGKLSLHTDGSGTITFGESRYVSVPASGFGRSTTTAKPLFQLVNIANANRVSTMIEDAKAQLYLSKHGEREIQQNYYTPVNR